MNAAVKGDRMGECSSVGEIREVNAAEEGVRGVNAVVAGGQGGECSSEGEN